MSGASGFLVQLKRLARQSSQLLSIDPLDRRPYIICKGAEDSSAVHHDDSHRDLAYLARLISPFCSRLHLQSRFQKKLFMDPRNCNCRLGRIVQSWGSPNLRTPRIYHEASSVTPRQAPQNFSCQISALVQAPSTMQQLSEVHDNSMIRAARRVSSCLSVKTSVTTRVNGMKALLPLTLSTTSLDTQIYKPQHVEEIQSPITTINRLTFGGHEELPVEESPKKIQKSPRSKKLSRRGRHSPRLPLSIHPERRDIPVYTDAGSPIPSPAYFTMEFPHTLSPTNSCLSEEEWLAGCSSPNSETSPHPNDKDYPMDPTKVSPDQSFGSSTIGNEPTSYHSSELSFQCLGEQIDVKEPDGRKKPFDGMANLDSMCLPDVLAQSMPPKSIVEGWLGSVHNVDDNDSIAEAVPPSVRLSANTSTTFTNPAFKIPPRSSSLTGTRPTLFWKTKSENSTNCMTAHDGSPYTAYDSHAPSPVFDTESLPSSVSSHDEPPTPPPKEKDYFRQLPHSSHGLEPSMNQFHTTEANNIPLDIIRDKKSNLYGCALSIIEDLIRYLPFSTFTDYRYHIYSVRTQICTCTYHAHSDFLNPPPLQHDRPTSPFKSFPSRRMTLSFSNLTGSAFNSRTPSPDTFRSAPPKHAISTHLDLDPLQRIFPLAPTSMIQALYAYILAYILINQIRSLSPPPGTPNSGGARANSITTMSPSRIPNKAASMLGIPILDHGNANISNDPQVTGLIEDFVLSQRVKSARTSLENSIFGLVRGMGDDGGDEEGMQGAQGQGQGQGQGPKGFVEGILGRALVEVVRGAEGRAEGGGDEEGGF